MQAYETMDLDSMMRDIVDIFRLDGVQLVRLTGLYRRELGISNYKGLTPEQLDNIVHKLNKAGLIHYYYITVCPHCGERSYHTVKTKNVCAARKCDTCNNLYIPQHERTLFEVAQDANV